MFKQHTVFTTMNVNVFTNVQITSKLINSIEV